MGEKVVGILGGMGPEATVDLMARIIKATPALDDIDHIRMVVDNNPKVPSRIKALLEGGGESPVPCLQQMARQLVAWGVDFLAMPCNTAHYYHGEIQKAVPIPLLDMIDIAVEATTAQIPGMQAVGLLASTVVVNLKLYEKAFSRKHIRVVTPSPQIQDGLMAVIRKIKTGRHGAEVGPVLQEAAEQLIKDGAEALLVACTELSIVAGSIQTRSPLVDAAQVLAEAIVREARSFSPQDKKSK